MELMNFGEVGVVEAAEHVCVVSAFYYLVLLFKTEFQFLLQASSIFIFS